MFCEAEIQHLRRFVDVVKKSLTASSLLHSPLGVSFRNVQHIASKETLENAF
jgi:hypothetical protein